MTNAPLITIGITCYNAQDTITRAVNSALAQDYPNTEIIIIDDASTDQSIATIHNIIDHHPGIKLIKHDKNQGVAAARNLIIENAKGDFLAFFDDDDQSLPGRLTAQYHCIANYENAYNARAICYAARLQLYPDQSQRIEMPPGINAAPKNTPNEKNNIAPHGHAIALRILTGKPAANMFGSMATCSQMARLDIYRSLDGFDPDFQRSEDTDFNIRSALADIHFIGLKQPLVTQTMTHASEKTLEAEEKFTLQLLDKHQNFIDQYSNYKFCRKWIIAKHKFLRGQKSQFIMDLITLAVRHPILTAQRLLWSLPNIGFNLTSKKFHAS